MADTLKPLIAKAIDAPLTRAEAEAAFGIIMSGEATPAQTGGFLMVLRTRGESVDEAALHEIGGFGGDGERDAAPVVPRRRQERHERREKVHRDT